MSTNFMNTYDDERVSRGETMYRRDTQVRQRPAYPQGGYGYQEYSEYAEPRYRRDQYPEARRTSPAAKGAVVGVVVALAIVCAFAFGTGLFRRVANKVLPPSLIATTSTTRTTEAASQPANYADGGQMISSDDAIRAAANAAAGGNDVRNAMANLEVGGDAAHYVVTFDFDDAHYTVEVDAYTGDVWSVTPTFNDSTFEPELETAFADGDEIVE